MQSIQRIKQQQYHSNTTEATTTAATASPKSENGIKEKIGQKKKKPYRKAPKQNVEP